MANELDKVEVDLNEKWEIFLAKHQANIRIVASWGNPPNWKVICNLMFFSKKEIKRITQFELETKLNLELHQCQKKKMRRLPEASTTQSAKNEKEHK